MNKYIVYTSCLMLSWAIGLIAPCKAQNKRNVKRAEDNKSCVDCEYQHNYC